MQSRKSELEERNREFDPLEFDRYTRLQELTRMMAEGLNDAASIQQSLLKNLGETDAALLAQGVADLGELRAVGVELLLDLGPAALDDRDVALQVVEQPAEVRDVLLQRLLAGAPLLRLRLQVAEVLGARRGHDGRNRARGEQRDEREENGDTTAGHAGGGRR
jgi:hypothetical protein